MEYALKERKKEEKKEQLLRPFIYNQCKNAVYARVNSETAHLKHHIIRTGILLVAATIEYQRL